MKKTIYTGFIAILALASCQKTEGEGGTLTLRGKVWVDDYTNAGNYKGSYWGMDEDVFIIYGDNATYDDATSTNYDGTYEFRNLYPGTYTIFAYSDCDTCTSGTIPVLQTIEIEGKGEVVELENLVVRR